MTKIKSMGKIVAVSVMSMLVSISFNGCGFFKSTGNQALASLGNAAGQSVSNALSSKSSSNESKAKSANDKNDSGKCSSNEIKTDKSVEKGECKGGKRNGVWKYYDNYGYIQQEITFQNGEMTIEKAYDKDENLSYMTRYNNGKPEYQRVYTKGKLSIFTYSKIDSTVDFGRSYEIEKLIWQIEARTREAKEQAQEVAQKRAESKVKKPTMQEVKNSKNAMDTYRANLQAQVEKELQIELNGKVPSIPNFDTLSDEQIVAFVNNNKLTPQQEQVYSVEPITDGSLRLIKTAWDSPIYFQRYNKANEGMRGGNITTWEQMGQIYGGSCEVPYDNFKYKENYNCRTFATQYKELIDKSAFKDKIYNALPKPKNQ